MRRIISPRRWITASAPSRSTKCRWSGASTPAIKLDFRHFPNGYVATAKDVEAELKRIGHTLKPLDIVWSIPAAGKAYGQPDYVATGCGMGREATIYLLERGVRVTGTDGWSWDAPFVYTKERFAKTNDPVDHLGRPPRRPRNRLLPYREAAQSRSAAVVRLHGQLLPGENPRCLRRLDPGDRHSGLTAATTPHGPRG